MADQKTAHQNGGGQDSGEAVVPKENTFTEGTLEAVCTLVTDGTHDTPKVVESGFPLVKAKEIVGGTIDFDSCARINEDEHRKVIARSKPEKGDTLFAHIGASLGEAAYVDTRQEFSIKNIALFKPDPSIIDPRYLYFLVIGPVFQEMAKQTRTGSAQPFLGLGQLRDHRIRYHQEIGVQKKIATILSAYDDLIENNERRIKILEDMAQNLYREWFVNLRFPGHEKVKMVDSPLGMIPEGWKACKYGDRIELLYGKALKKADRRDGCVPVYGSSGVVGYHEGELVGGPGIILGRKGNVGSVHWSSMGFYPIDTVFYVKSDLSLHYLYYNLREQTFINTDAAVPGLNRNTALAKLFTLPAQDLLAQFEDWVGPVFKSAESLSQRNENLRQTRDLLLPKLISGELDVSELNVEISEGAA